tara:strand:+ start:242 stop:397 length:156 start_codon:yes stop_codon:yes gene_type:complete
MQMKNKQQGGGGASTKKKKKQQQQKKILLYSTIDFSIHLKLSFYNDPLKLL